MLTIRDVQSNLAALNHLQAIKTRQTPSNVVNTNIKQPNTTATAPSGDTRCDND